MRYKTRFTITNLLASRYFLIHILIFTWSFQLLSYINLNTPSFNWKKLCHLSTESMKTSSPARIYSRQFFSQFLLWGPTVSGAQTTLEEARPSIWSHMYELCEKGPGPTFNLRVREYPRTINKGRNKVLLWGEVKNARGDLIVSEDYSHLGTSVRGVWWTYQSFRITPRTNPTAKWKGKISNRR